MSDPLWKIAEEVKQAIDKHVDPETGEILTEEGFDILESVEMRLDEKALAVARYGVVNRDEAEKVARQAKRLAKRATVLKSRSEWAQNYLDTYLAKPVNLSDDMVEIGMRKSSSVFVPEDAEPKYWDERFVKTTYEARKSELAKAIKAGELVPPGVVIQEKNRVVIK